MKNKVLRASIVSIGISTVGVAQASVIEGLARTMTPECIPESAPSHVGMAALEQTAIGLAEKVNALPSKGQPGDTLGARAELKALLDQAAAVSAAAQKNDEPAKKFEGTQDDAPALKRIRETITLIKGAERAGEPPTPNRLELEAKLKLAESVLKQQAETTATAKDEKSIEQRLQRSLKLVQTAKAALTESNIAGTKADTSLEKALDTSERELLLSSRAVRSAATVTTPMVQTLGKFSAQLGDGNTLATTELISAYAPFGRRNCGGKAVGFRASATATSNSDDMREYGRQQLLLRDGGLLNLTLSFTKTLAQAPLTNKGEVANGQGENWRAIRATYTDRLYSNRALHNNRSQYQLWGYFLNGLTVKGIKTHSDTDGPNRAVGSVYLGGGWDGPLFQTQGPASESGGVDFNLRLAAHFTNRSTMGELLQREELRQRHYFTSGVTFTAYLPGQFSARVEYQAPFGASRRALGDLAIFSIGYGQPAAPKEGEANATTTP